MSSSTADIIPTQALATTSDDDNSIDALKNTLESSTPTSSTTTTNSLSSEEQPTTNQDSSGRGTRKPLTISVEQNLENFTIRDTETLKSGESVKVGPQNFYKVAKLGNGFCGSVYLVQSQGLETNGMFAMKIIKKDDMIKRNRVRRVLTERDILSISNHPFVVTLHYSFQTPKHLYLVMTYCAGGEFFAMLHRQEHKRFSEAHAAFYAAEVLLALEYLHLLGLIYRDLKPENLLVHESGHIMLTDFDLSTSQLKKSSLNVSPSKKKQPLWFRMKSGRVILNPARQQHNKSILFGACCCDGSKNYPDVDTESHLNTGPRRKSFVGTHEYIAPEIILEAGYAGSVDWWSFGVLLYEMVVGHTPFRGRDDMNTLENIVGDVLTFPDDVKVSSVCKDLLRRLLHKDVALRMKNPIEIRSHPFFKDINWALVRNMTPPVVPTVSNSLDTRNFHKYKSDDDSDDELPLHPSSPKKDKKPVIPVSEELKNPEVQKLFSSYNYQNPSAGGHWAGDLSSTCSGKIDS